VGQLYLWLMINDETTDIERQLIFGYHDFLIWFFKAFFILPTYFSTLLVNDDFYLNIAKRTMELKNSKDSLSQNYQSYFEKIYDLVKQPVLTIVVILLMSILKMTPYIGFTLYFLYSCCLYSYYCFDYKWALTSWGVDYRIYYYDTHWLYLLSFGLPFTVLYMVIIWFFSMETWVGLGIYSVLYPFFLIMSVASKEQRYRSVKYIPYSISFFREANTLSEWAIELVRRWVDIEKKEEEDK